MILLAIAFGGSSQSALYDIESQPGADGGPSASATNQASSQFQRPTGIYAIGLAAQPPPRELLEKPFVDGVALAQEWRTVEPTRGNYNFSTIDATLALLEQYQKKLTLTIFPFRAPDYLINDPQVQTYTVAHAGPNIILPVPWDATGLARYEALFQALGDHLVPNAAQGGAQVRFRDHPLMAGMPAWPMGMNGIRDVCAVSGRCPAISNVPNYSRQMLTNGILRSLHIVVDQFPSQFHYVPLFRISDQTASPALDVYLLAAIKQDFFNGSGPPQMGLYQENLSCQGPSTAGAPALFQEQNNTYTMIQALQSWLTLAPYNSPGSTDPCLVTTVPNDRTTAVSGPEVGIQYVYQTFGVRYFEIYLADLLHPGFADEFEQWSNILNGTVNAPPSITTQPSDQTVAQGQLVTFNVAATGSTPLSYQWRRDTVNITGANSPSYTISTTVMADSGTKFRCVVTNTFGTATSNEATLTVQPPPPPPVIWTEENTDSAIAFDSVTMMRDPFPLTTLFNFSSDNRTRLMLFAAKLDLLPGEDNSAVTARAEDAQLNIYPLTIEFIGKIPNFEWLTQVIVRLPDNLPTGQDVWVSFTLQGQTSNKARMTIK